MMDLLFSRFSFLNAISLNNLSGCFVSFYLILVLVVAGSAQAEIVAEYTGTSNNGLVISTSFTHAMAFDVTGTPTITEVQLNLSRWSGSTGTTWAPRSNLMRRLSA